MRWRFHYIPILICCLLITTTTSANEIKREIKIAFGSCLNQARSQPVWKAILAEQPELFLFAGDNIYPDRGLYYLMQEPQRIQQAYEELNEHPDFQQLRSTTTILATWDDHDYGRNDAGKDYPHKEQSKNYFLEFFNFPEDAPLRQHEGIYHSYYQPTATGPIQIILLDTRSFRSSLVHGQPDQNCRSINLVANNDKNSTILGKAQWQWLKQELQKPARLRIIVSSIQVIPDSHCFEKWSNFPHEREKLFNLISEHHNAPVILVSGDRHLAEISRMDLTEDISLFEVTSSGLNTAGAGRGESNHYRVTETNVRRDNFGLLTIDPDILNSPIRLQLKGIEGQVLQEFVVNH